MNRIANSPEPTLQQRIHSLQISAADRQRFARELERAESVAAVAVDLIRGTVNAAAALRRTAAGWLGRPRGQPGHAAR